MSLESLIFDERTPEVRCRRKRPSPPGKLTETLDPLESLARVLVHVAEPRLHAARYYGRYSSVARGRRARAGHEEQARQAVALEKDIEELIQAALRRWTR